MSEIADKHCLQHTIQIVRAAAEWEREAQLLSRQEYESLVQALEKLAQAVDLLTPELPADLQP
jgi:hypothetical protein